MKLLLSGFEPFGGSDINPSEQIVKALVASGLDDVELIPIILPVDRYTGPDALVRTYISAQPDAVLSLGQSGRSPDIAVERVAINLLDFPISDNAGHLVTDKAIITNGADAYFATLPVREAVSRLTAAGIPARLSHSAGTFLCNQVMYEMLHFLHKHDLSTPAGFVHVPRLPQQVAGATSARPSMSLEVMVTAVTHIMETIAQSLSQRVTGTL